MHTHLHQALDVLHSAQIFGVHDVRAVFILKGGHGLVRARGILQQKHLVGGRTCTQGGLDNPHNIAQFVLAALLSLVLPAASIGATALVGVAFVDIARQQAAPGIGHAQRTMNKDFQLHARHFLANFANFFQRQLA